jgi:hypothetical protein
LGKATLRTNRGGDQEVFIISCDFFWKKIRPAPIEFSSEKSDFRKRDCDRVFTLLKRVPTHWSAMLQLGLGPSLLDRTSRSLFWLKCLGFGMLCRFFDAIDLETL